MTAFSQGATTVVAGTTLESRLQLRLPQSVDLVGAYVTWELMDADGRVWNQGNGGTLVVAPSQTASADNQITSDCTIAVPSQIPVNEFGTNYQIRYTLNTSAPQPIWSFDSITVQAPEQNSLGSPDVVEIVGQDVQAYITLPQDAANCMFEVYQGNTLRVTAQNATSGTVTAQGTIWTAEIGAPDIAQVGLMPYTVMWSYDRNGQRLRETSSVYVVNPSVLDAVQQVQRFINRAYTDSGINPGTTFSDVDVINYLRAGRDQFNAMDKPTMISMINAAGPFRHFWINYSCAAACRAQQLAEGMKAFNYAGQSVTLDVDRGPYWEAQAQNLEQALESQIKNFKDNLYKRGILDGDGSSLALRAGAVGAIGISIHAASPYGGAFRFANNGVGGFYGAWW